MSDSKKELNIQEKGFPIGVFSQNIYIPAPHHHIEYEFFYLDDGRAIMGIENTEYKIFPGDMIFIETGTNHYVRSVIKGEKFHFYALVFDIAMLGQEDDPTRKTFESIKLKRFLQINKRQVENLKYISELQKNREFGREIQIKAVLLELIAYIIKSGQYEIISATPFTSKHPSSAIENALSYIKEHYRENIDVQDILSMTNYSKSHFSRLFKDSLGLSITEYINEYRIEKACLNLIYTNKNITEIATENGFNNIQYFSRTFKKFMKCTPKQYQRKASDLVVPSTIAKEM